MGGAGTNPGKGENAAGTGRPCRIVNEASVATDCPSEQVRRRVLGCVSHHCVLRACTIRTYFTVYRLWVKLHGMRERPSCFAVRVRLDTSGSLRWHPLLSHKSLARTSWSSGSGRSAASNKIERTTSCSVHTNIMKGTVVVEGRRRQRRVRTAGDEISSEHILVEEALAAR